MLWRHHHTDKIFGKLLCNSPVCTKIKKITEIEMFYCFFTIIKQIDIFTFFIFQGVCYGLQVMQTMESPNVPFTILRTRFKTGN